MHAFARNCIPFASVCAKMASGGGEASSLRSPSPEHEFITILKIGNKVKYTVPSFPVFNVQLVQIKFQFADEGSTDFFDGYIRACPALDRTYPALLKVHHGHTNAFYIEEEEFERCIPVENDVLYGGKVFIIWKWTWEDAAEHNQSVLDDFDERDDSSESDNNSQQEDAFQSTLVTHSLIFKCIGATKSHHYQEALAKAAEEFKEGGNIEVRVRKEPTNPKDARAIAFDCKLGHDWKIIGYVVKEALDGVHDAIQTDSIISVQFDWIRYITHWSGSGPGWYCGIKISKRGDWPKEVVRCSSTM